MESKIHSLLEWITPGSPNSHLILPLILRQFLTDSGLLQKGWDPEYYTSLEKTREYAQKYGHCLEETIILCFENKYLRTKHEDNDKFLATVARMTELGEMFSRDDDYFREIYCDIYPAHSKFLRYSVNRWIDYMYGKAEFYSNFFSGNLDYKAALLCSNVMLKIAVVAPENVISDKVIEALFARAMDYGNIRDYNSSFKFYNMAIEKARETDDKAYMYIAVQRKLSVCMGLSQLDSQSDFDIERMSCVDTLNGMLAETVTNAEDLGNQLIQQEKAKKRKASFKKKAYYRERIGKLKEAIPMLSVQLAMSRGDKVTSRKYIDKLKEAEHRVYGGNPGFSRADMLENMYDMLFNSPEREEYEERQCNASNVADDYLGPVFPDYMILGDKFNLTLFSIRNFILGGLFKSAENYCTTLQQLADQTKSDYHKAMAINARGQILEAEGQIQPSIEMYQKALSVLENADLKISDADLSPYLYYSILCEIGSLQKKAIPEEAVNTFTRAMEWLHKHNMPQMLFMSQILNGRADAYDALGNREMAEKDRSEFLRFATSETKRRILLMDQDSRDIFWNDTRKLIDKTVSHINPESGDEFKSESYSAVLLSKGILLCNERLLKVAAKSNPKLAALYDELQNSDIRKHIWGTSYIESEYTEGYLKTMQLSSELNGLLKETDDKVFPDCRILSSCLGQDEVVIDYYDFEVEGGDRQYIAFVLKSGRLTPDVALLCKESEMTDFFEKYTSVEKKRKEVEFSVIYEPFLKVSHELQGKIWNSVEKLITPTSSTRVYFVPSGSLHKVALESLPYGTSWSLTLSDRFSSFSRLSHSRVLLNRAVSPTPDTIGIVAGIDYGMETCSKPTTGKKGYSVSMYEEVLTAEDWQQLPFTTIECQEIQQLFKDKGWLAITLTGQNATVERFKGFSETSPSILHISTHGFAETRKSAVNLPALKDNFRPMDLTGIVLSNGNEGWLKGTAEKHEGIMLASEIAKMDLSKTDIVFLSCCYSGEGIVKADGIYGLQRALLLAGAKTIIMSLWAVNEYAGLLFAKTFYSSYLKNKDRHQAFTEARMAVREQFIDDQLHNQATGDPYYWAGFIMLD